MIRIGGAVSSAKCTDFFEAARASPSTRMRHGLSPPYGILRRMIPCEPHPTVTWHRDRLRVRAPRSWWVWCRWPDLSAWHYDGSQWCAQWPLAFDLNQAVDLSAPAVNWCVNRYRGVWDGGQPELPLFEGVRLRVAQAPAWRAFCATIPHQIQQWVRQFDQGQWACLVLLARNPAADDLVQAHPNVFWALANAPMLRGQPATDAARGALLAKPLKEVLRSCGCPPIAGLRQLVDRIDPYLFSQPGFLAEFTRALDEPAAVELLRHTPKEQIAVQFAIVDPPTRPWLTPKLVAQWMRERRPGDPGLDELADLTRGGCAPQPLQCLAHMRRVVAAWRTEQWARQLPPPPDLPADRRIRALRTVAELRAEGRDMRNCLYTHCFAYARRIAAGHLYAYAISDPRVTVTVAPTEYGWDVEELAGPDNIEVSNEVWAWVRNWVRGGRRGVAEKRVSPLDPKRCEATGSTP